MSGSKLALWGHSRCSLLALAVAGASMGGWCPAYAQVATTNNEPEQAPSDDEGETPEGGEIVVTGIRASLGSSLNIKRGATQIVDAITSEEIGKFPDQNVTEAIQRIPGVNISRSDGEGEQVNVRGFAPTFTRVELNGRSLPSSTNRPGDTTRSPVLASFTADLFRSVIVVKSPTARDVEGGLGGIVRLNTPQPLQIGKFASGGEVSLSKYQGDGGFDKKLTGYLNNTFAKNTFGVYVGANYDTTNYLQSSYFGNGRRHVRAGQISDPVEQEGLTDALIPRRFWYREGTIKSRRFNIVTGFQWRPTTLLEFFGDVVYARWSRPDTADEFFVQPQSGQISNATVDSSINSVVAATMTNSNFIADRAGNDVQQRDLGFSGNVKYSPGPWIIEAGVSYQGLRKTEDRPLIEIERTGDYSFDVREQRESGGAHIPILTFISPDILDLSTWTTSMFESWYRRDRGNEKTARLDVTRELGSSFLRSIAAGLRYSDHHAVRKFARVRNQTELNASLFADDIVAEDFMDGVLTTGWPSLDLGAAEEFLPVLTDADFANNIANFDLHERTPAAYVMGSFELPTLLGARGNVGVRVLRTYYSGRGVAQLPDGTFSPTKVSSDYTAVLPSANLTMDLARNTFLRFAFSKALTRPEINDLAPSTSVNTSGGELTASVGNPNLKPFKALQFDASLEHYFMSDALASVAVFHKKITNFTDFVVTSRLGRDIGIRDPELVDRTFLVTTPENGGSGSITGLELGFQTPFTFLPAPFDGFGTILNYTRIWSKRVDIDGEEIPVEGLSKNTLNVIGYYEKGPFSFRAAYNFRDGYLYENFGSGDPLDNLGNRINRDFVKGGGRLDLSARWTVRPGISVSADAANLTNNSPYQFADDPLVARRYYVDSRRFTLGVSFTY